MRLMLEVEMPQVLVTHLFSGDLRTTIHDEENVTRYDIICTELKAGRFQLYEVWAQEP